jgi:hypothetical protein
MSIRPKPPEYFDENPPLDADFFARARPASPGETTRLRAALKRIVAAHDQGRPVDDAIARARETLVEDKGW